MTDPLDQIEFEHGIEGLASGMRTFYEALIKQGFTEPEALLLTTTWLAAVSQPK
jgi:hypothetical protein